MENQEKDPRQAGRVLPEDVLNAAQDPASMKDPLQQQLEKSEGHLTPGEQHSLDQVREEYGGDGEPKP